MRRRPEGPDRRGLRYVRDFVRPEERRATLDWLATLHPLWERRFPDDRPPPAGEVQRTLLRPVYWLGNWQFACLGYYTPPHGVLDRCVAAEPFPPPLAAWVRRIEHSVRTTFPPAFVPDGWHLDTCLVNFYGTADGEDRARVGDHRDHEPGPVASVSLGARALFRFVTRTGGPIADQWLDDSSLQIFAGPTWKERAFHRVQRVDKGDGERLGPTIPGFGTRRVNFTFRYVPDRLIVPYARLAPTAQRDVAGYVEELARFSTFWADARAGCPPP